jgi:hypothetical protein
METNRDAMHAAGGAFIVGQQKAEAATPVARTDNAHTERAAAQREARGPRAVLDLREDYDLIAWMHCREPKWGETAADIFEQARAALPKITKLNVDHIKTRLDALSETLPKATPPVRELTLEERIARTEKGLSIFAHWMLEAQSTAPQLAWLADFLSETGL